MIVWLLGLPQLFGGAIVTGASGVSAADCGQCHAAIGEQWRASRHARAWVNPTFTRSFADARDPWCKGCHLPLADQRGSASTVPKDEGVTCAACHVREGTILSAHEPTALAVTQHPIRVEPALGTSAFCAGCHEFAFPLRERVDGVSFSSNPLQSTFAEWTASGSDRTCADCHLDGHRFRDSRDAPFVDAALEVDVLRDGDGWQARLAAPGAAHAVPTGDPFRRLVVTVASDPDCENPLGTATFGRRLASTPNSWRVSADTTIPPAGSRTVAIEATGDPAAGAWYCVDLWHADPETEASLPADERSTRIRTGRTATSGTPR